MRFSLGGKFPQKPIYLRIRFGGGFDKNSGFRTNKIGGTFWCFLSYTKCTLSTAEPVQIMQFRKYWWFLEGDFPLFFTLILGGFYPPFSLGSFRGSGTPKKGGYFPTFRGAFSDIFLPKSINPVNLTPRNVGKYHLKLG